MQIISDLEHTAQSSEGSQTVVFQYYKPVSNALGLKRKSALLSGSVWF